METLYSILGVVVFIGIGYLMLKAQRAAGNAVNQKILYRSEHKEGQELVSEPYKIQASASIQDIIRELDSHVIVAEDNSGYKAVVYVSSRSENRITYAYGNKFAPKTFEAVVELASSGGITAGIFKMLTWHERGGLITGQDYIYTLRKQVEVAFAAADASVRVTENAANNN